MQDRNFLGEFLTRTQQPQQPLASQPIAQEESGILIQALKQQPQRVAGLVPLAQIDTREALAKNLLSQANDRNAHPLARGIAAFFGAKTLQETGAERGRTEGAISKAEAERKRIEREEDLSLQREGLDLQREGLDSRDEQFNREFGLKQGELKRKELKNKKEIEKLDAEIKKINKESEGIGELPDEDRVKIEGDLRKEFTKMSGEFIKQRDAFNRINASAEDPSAAGDLALIFNYMKLLDPGSTVREGEFATAQNAAGVDGRILAKYNNVIRGERLGEAQRGDFLDRSNKLFTTAEAQQEQTNTTFRKLAESAKVSPDNVVIEVGAAGENKTDETPSVNEFEGFKIKGRK
jgi:hypothetical protein